ncbi:hypothetical protein AAG570_001274 [Ranatra chinensis]|uniref:Peptidase S1 domain-containing protein n=1 Tax=Ranatra chinensis TaxID=642074 RepID=A0ABD0YBD7_9HEMI
MSRLSNSRGFLLTLKTGREDGGLIECTAQAVGGAGGAYEEETTTRRPNPYDPPYLNQPSSEIDSAEHGGPPGPLTTTCPCGMANKKISKIVGGKETEINEFPFAVMLVLRGSYSPFCGGSIISRQHVLTAAHCVIKYIQHGITVIAGDHDYTDDRETDARLVVDVRQVIMHSEYPSRSEYDIALLVLDSPLQYNKYIAPVCLPHRQLNLEGQYLKALGWGRTSPHGRGSSFLKKVNVRALSLSVCQDYAGVERTERHQICTYSKMKGLGKGDSGGPVIWLNKDTNRYTLVGLPSYVFFYDGNEHILPDVSTDVSSFLPWIHQNMRSNRFRLYI